MSPPISSTSQSLSTSKHSLLQWKICMMETDYCQLPQTWLVELSVTTLQIILWADVTGRCPCKSAFSWLLWFSLSRVRWLTWGETRKMYPHWHLKHSNASIQSYNAPTDIFVCCFCFIYWKFVILIRNIAAIVSIMKLLHIEYDIILYKHSMPPNQCDYTINSSKSNVSYIRFVFVCVFDIYITFERQQSQSFKLKVPSVYFCFLLIIHYILNI